MKKHVKQFLSGLLVCCMVMALTACSGGIEKQILGSWAPIGEDEYMTFYSSGTLAVESFWDDDVVGTWRISDGNRLTMSLDGEEITVEVTDISSDGMIWEINGESLALLKRD